MIGIILLITLLIGLLALVVVLIYSRQSEVELTDRSVDLGDVLPIQTCLLYTSPSPRDS